MKTLQKIALVLGFTVSGYALAGSYVVNDESSLREKLQTTVAGDTIIIQQNTSISLYGLADLEIKNGVTIWGRAGASIVNANSNKLLWFKNKDSNVNNVHITSVSLDGIGIELKGNYSLVNEQLNTTNSGNRVGYVQFKNTKALADTTTDFRNQPFRTPFIYVKGLNGIKLDNNTFRRPDAADTGKGILLIDVKSAQVDRNKFYGYFQNSINGNFLHDSSVTYNTINKTKISYDEALQQWYWPNNAERYSRKEDHGIYIGYFKNLNITNNNVSGYSTSGMGNSLKLRDGNRATIANNRFNDSGIELANYKPTTGTSRSFNYDFFTDIEVKNNLIHLNQNNAENRYKTPLKNLSCNQRGYNGIYYIHNSLKNAVKIDIKNNTIQDFSYKKSGAITLLASHEFTGYLTWGKGQTNTNVTLNNNSTECIYTTGNIVNEIVSLL